MLFLDNPLTTLFAIGLARAQTLEERNLSHDGAHTVLHAAEQKAQLLSTSLSVAVLDASGGPIIFEQMQGST